MPKPKTGAQRQAESVARGRQIAVVLRDPAAIDALTNPTHRRNCHAVAACLVSRTVWRSFAAVANVGVAVTEPLQPFALGRRQPTDSHARVDRWRLALSQSG